MSLRNALYSLGLAMVAIAGYSQSPGLAWVGVFDGDNTKSITNVAIDNSGNVYAAGLFYGTLDVDPQGGEQLITSQDQADGVIVKMNSDGELVWVVQLPGDGNQNAFTVNVDGAGNIVVSGYFEQTVDFDPGPGVASHSSPSGMSAFLMKLSPAGTLLWVKPFINPDGTSFIASVAIDETNNNIFISGQITGTADTDPSAATVNLVSAGFSDIWVAKFDPTGNYLNAVRAGGGGADFPKNITLDENKDVIVGGTFSGTVDLDPGPGTTTFTSNGGDDVFIQKLSNGLGYVWAKQISATSQFYLGGLSTDASNNIIFNGSFFGTADFDPNAGTFNLSGVNGDFFITSFSAAGDLNWAKRAGSLGLETGDVLSVDGSGNIYVAGGYYEQFDINPNAPVEIAPSGQSGTELYFAKFANDGSLLWFQPIPSEDFVSPVHLNIDGNNNIYIAGDWNGEVNFSTNFCIDGKRVTHDNALAFVVKFTPTSDIGCFGFLEQPEPVVTGCEGQEVFISARAGGTTHITYQWQIFDGTWDNLNDQESNAGINGYEGTNTPYLEIDPVPGGQVGDIRVVVNGDGVSTIYSNTVIFSTAPTPPVPGVTATSGCGPGYYGLQAYGTSSDFNWYIDDALVDDVHTSDFSYFFNSNAIVGVTATDAGCESNKSVVAINTDACSQPPGLVWVNQLGPGLIIPVGMVTDGNHDIYIAGQFYDAVDFDLGSGNFTLTPNGTSDSFVAKYKADGAFLWAKQTDMDIMDVAVGGGEDVYYVGNFEGTVDFDPGPGTFDMTVSGSGSDMAVVYLETDGQFEWAIQLRGTSGENGNHIRAVTDTPLEEIVITGSFTRTVDFDPGTGTANLTSASSAGPDIFVAKYDETGALMWAKRMGSTAFVERGHDVEVDGAGNIYTVGVFQTTVDFNPNAGTDSHTSAGQTDGFIQALDAAGNFRWAKTIGSIGADEAISVDVDDAGNPVIGGHFSGVVDFDPGGGTSNVNGGPSFILKLTAAGNFDWARGIGGDLVKVLVGPTNEVFVTGSYEGDIDVDPGPDVYTLETAVTADIYLSQLSSTGDFLWAYNTNGSGLEYFENEPVAVAVDDVLGDIYLAGFFTNMIDMDPTDCTLPIQTTMGSRETFLQKIQLNLATICFALEPRDVTGCDGGEIHLVSQAVGTTGITYQWQYYNFMDGLFQDIPLAPGYSGSTTNELIIFSTLSFGEGTYRVVVSGDNASDQISNEAEVTVGTTPAAPAFTPVTFCSPGQKTMVVSGASDGDFRWYEDQTAPPIDGEVNGAFKTPFLEATTTYYATVINGGCESDFTQVDVVINITLDSPTVTDGSSCTAPASITLAASGATGSQDYRWYRHADDEFPEDEYDPTFVATVSATTSYFVAIGDGVCEGLRVEVVAYVGSSVTPTASAVSNCGPGTVTLTASGGTDGNYRWYTQATGGTAIAGEVNGTYVTPPLSSTTQYFVALDDGSCESARVPAIAVIDTPPGAPAANGTSVCPNTSAALTASSGTAGEFRWYAAASGGSPLHTGATYNTPNLTTTTTYHVALFDTKCESSRTAVTVTVSTCTTNAPPVIAASASSAGIEGTVTIDLTALISDPDNNLDLSTLRIVVPPKSGAIASIDQNGQLHIDYAGLTFEGEDELTIEVCDLAGICAQRLLTINVSGELTVYNAVSPNGDGKNDVLYLNYVDLIPGTKDNKVTIFNRWGEVVFEVDNYNNTTNVFSGKNRNGNDLPSGTYFYRIVYHGGRPAATGYLSLKR